MSEHYVDARVIDVTAPNEIHQHGNVAADGNHEQHTVRGDGHNVAVVECHVDRQRR